MRGKKSLSILLFLFILLINLNGETTLSKMLAASNRMIKKVDVREAYRWYKNKSAVFIDVDEPSEYKKSTIPGAINIPRGVIEFKINRYVNKRTRVVIFSGKGKRGILATYNLQGLGYNVYNLNGGKYEWRKNGFPIKKRNATNSLSRQSEKRKFIRRIK